MVVVQVTIWSLDSASLIAATAAASSSAVDESGMACALVIASSRVLRVAVVYSCIVSRSIARPSATAWLTAVRSTARDAV